MHMDQAPGAGSFMKIIDILGDDEQIAGPSSVQFRQGVMSGIRLNFVQFRAPLVIEAMHQRSIALQRLWRADIFDPMPFPQTVGPTKSREAAFGRDARAGQDHDIADVFHRAIMCLVPTESYSFADDKAEPFWHRASRFPGMSGIMTKIGLFGAAGRMGRAIAQVAVEAGLTISGGTDRDGSGDLLPGMPITADPLALAQKSDVLIDFSVPGALAAHLDACVAAGKPVLIGTTGLEQAHHQLIDSAAQHIPVLQTGNTSLGVNLLAALVEQAAARLGGDWDIEIVAMHHRHKVDAPSGTALLLGNAAAQGRGIDLAANSESGRYGITGARKQGTIGFAALRGGSVAGDHQVIFAADGERIELGHRAESRVIFARGALKGANWLIGQPAGRYDMKAVLGL